WEAFKKVISRRNIRRRITIPLTLSNLKLLRRITRTENILHRNFTRRQVAIQNGVASNIGISQSTLPPRFGGMKTYNWEGVNPDGYFLDKLEPIPSALPSFQKLFQVSATALSI